MTRSKSTHTINHLDGSKQVPTAYRAGYFAVHRMDKEHGTGWIIDHLPTGFSMGWTPTLGRAKLVIAWLSRVVSPHYVGRRDPKRAKYMLTKAQHAKLRKMRCA